MTAARAAIGVVLQPEHLRRTCSIAVVVGLVLTAINHGDTILGGDAGAGTAIKAALNFVVPFIVSNLGLLAGRHDELRQRARGADGGSPGSEERMAAARNEAVIRRFYDRLWNRWELELADEIVAPDVRFRGSLGTELTGVEAFRDYVRDVQAAFPDWHNRIDELIATGDRVVARLTWSGTHRGELLGVAPTGRFVTYVGAAIFRLHDGRIEEGWVVGDTYELWRTLGRLH